MRPASAGFCMYTCAMDYKRYDIVVIPPSDIAEQAITLSRTLAPLGTFFVLDGVKHHPHLSLYRVPFAESVLRSVGDALEKLAATTPSFFLEQGTYYPDQGMWVGVRYVTDQAILNLHTSVIATTREYRVIEDDARYKARWADLSPKQRTNIQECGWSDAYTRYSPHITFTKLQNPRADVLAHLPQREFSFLVDHLGLYELGEHERGDRLVADFWLTA